MNSDNKIIWLPVDPETNYDFNYAIKIGKRFFATSLITSYLNCNCIIIRHQIGTFCVLELRCISATYTLICKNNLITGENSKNQKSAQERKFTITSLTSVQSKKVTIGWPVLFSRSSSSVIMGVSRKQKII